MDTTKINHFIEHDDENDDLFVEPSSDTHRMCMSDLLRSFKLMIS